VLSWLALATASALMPWSMRTPWSAKACAVEPAERTLAATAASIGAATLAFAATARSIGAATSRSRSRSALRSSSDTTSLSGNPVASSAASSSALRPCSSLVDTSFSHRGRQSPRTEPPSGVVLPKVAGRQSGTLPADVDEVIFRGHSTQSIQSSQEKGRRSLPAEEAWLP
jgi:hypothetical protein